VSLFYLIPQMVGAGTLVRPLLGLSHQAGVLTVGVVVVLIVVTAGMVSTTYVQFIKGALLVLFCAVLAAMILRRGLTTEPPTSGAASFAFEAVPAGRVLDAPGHRPLPETGAWRGKPYVRIEEVSTGVVTVWRKLDAAGATLARTQTVTTLPGGRKLANG